MLFSEKLKKLRKDNSLTQEELSYKLNVSRQAVTKWECDEGFPDIDNLKQISNLFNVSIDELIKEDRKIDSDKKKKYSFIKELEIDHSKHFDINISSIYELNIKSNSDEVVKVEILSDNEELDDDSFKIVFDDLYNKLDIDIKKKKCSSDVSINLFLPEKYINDIELKSKMKLLNISNINFVNLEYDGELKYLNVNSSKGKIVLNTTKCDIEADYDSLDGSLEVNTINSIARVKIPSKTNYKTILKGKKNEFVDAISNDDALNTIELNGFNSKLIVIEK